MPPGQFVDFLERVPAFSRDRQSSPDTGTVLDTFGDADQSFRLDLHVAGELEGEAFDIDADDLTIAMAVKELLENASE